MAAEGCFIVVLVARTGDHLPLCSFSDENYKSSNSVQQHARRILEKMSSVGTHDPVLNPSKVSYQSFDHKDCIYFAMQSPEAGLTVIAAVNKLLVHTTGVKDLNELGCGLLDVVFAEFTQQFSPGEYLNSNVKPFQFIKFDSTLSKCVNMFTKQGHETALGVSEGKMTNRRGGGSVTSAGGNSTTRSSWNQMDSSQSSNPSNILYSQLRHEIAGVHDVIRRNYVELMERGEKLEVMDTYSARLRHDSSQYYKTAVRMNRMRLWKMYGPPAVVAIVFLLFITYYFFS